MRIRKNRVPTIFLPRPSKNPGGLPFLSLLETVTNASPSDLSTLVINDFSNVIKHYETLNLIMQGHTSIELIDSVTQLVSLRTTATAETKIITPVFLSMLEATVSKMWPAISIIAGFDSASLAIKVSMILEARVRTASGTAIATFLFIRFFLFFLLETPRKCPLNRAIRTGRPRNGRRVLRWRTF